MGRIQGPQCSEWTIREWEVALKKFYRMMYDEEMGQPDYVKRILNVQFLEMGVS
ncbi:MAG: hypothetical protein MUP63_03055 [Candidatus Nanohaloarchaeota archaeon QJJ-7]|nr:hypothetical protein [Candidatus Nanohaloarchaeota archaeon QJJ-7]